MLACPPAFTSTPVSLNESPSNCLRAVPAVQLCLIMDEVDGMSAGDRGGVADLSQVRPPAQRLL